LLDPDDVYPSAPPTPQPLRLSASIRVYELLTEREVEVLHSIGEHLTNQEIADRLYISPLTVKRHASNIYDKLGVNSRRQAIVKAAELGYL
jgi:DNA-binding CsgD family transcriptional regulator